MAEEALSAQEALEQEAASFLFGKDEPKEEVEAPKERVVEPVAEGDETDAEGEGLQAEETEAQEEVTEQEFVEVEFNGQLYEVPTELKDALMRESDYTKKTQDVAAQRKEIETIRGSYEQMQKQYEFAASIQDDVLKAQQLEHQADEAHKYLKDNIEALSHTDIERIRLAIEDARRERDEIVNSVTGKQQEFQQAQEQSHKELLNKGTEVLSQRIPGWGEDHQKKIRQYAIDSGFSEQEIASVVDPRQVEVLWKASQYDALKEGATPAVKKVQEAAQIKPKARDPKTGQFIAKEKVKKAQTLRKQGKITNADYANVLGNDIADRFFS